MEGKKGEKEIKTDEIEKAIRKLKKGKVAGEDGIQNKDYG